jgi:hypothetical protein
MKQATLVLVLLGLLVGASLAVPVDPNAEDGVAAIWPDNFDGFVRGFVWVLRTNGEVWRYDCEGVWRQSGVDPNLSGDLTVPVPVTEIADWTPSFFTTHSGTRWFMGNDEPLDYWTPLPAPPWSPVQSSPQSLGSVKEMFRDRAK